MPHPSQTPRRLAALALTAAGLCVVVAFPLRAQAPAAPGAGAPATVEVRSAATEAVANDEPAWTLAFDVRRLMTSPLANSVQASVDADGENKKFNEMQAKTGLNFANDIGAVVISGQNFENEDATLVANLASGGRLAGYFAEQPDHAVEALPGGGELHSFTLESQDGEPVATQVWASLRETAAGTRLVSSTSELEVRKLLLAEDLEDRLGAAELGGARILEFRAAQLPEGSVPAGMPGGEAIGAIRGITFALESAEQVGIDLRLGTENDATAKQLLQTLQLWAGMAPMVMPGLGLPPEQSQSIMEVLQAIQLSTEPAADNATPGVRMRLAVPQAILDGFVQSASEQAAPPFGGEGAPPAPADDDPGF